MIRTHANLVVLATDQAGKSGWSIHIGSSPAESGVATTAHERAHVMQLAQRHALSQNPSCNALSGFVFVFEDHTNVGRFQRGHGTLIGALHRWLEHLDLMGHLPEMRIGVTPNSWQRAVLGVRSSKVDSTERKAQAKRWASNHTQTMILSADQADAIALSAYGALEAERLIAQRRLQTEMKKLARRR